MRQDGPGRDLLQTRRVKRLNDKVRTAVDKNNDTGVQAEPDHGGLFDASVAGKERIRILLAMRGAQLSDFALKRGVCGDRAGEAHLPSELSMCLSGTREYPEIRQDLADFLGLERSLVDRWIDETAPEAEVA